MSGRPGGIALRIALAALVVAGVAIAILAVGVITAGGQSFADLMTEHGTDTAASRQMFTDSVGWVVVVAVIVAIVVAAAVAAIIGMRLARPLRDMSHAARRIAAGDYNARIPREGPEEIVSLADSFNQMAEALEEQERMRREFIANAAHELRTPLTNLQGYLEALRDGVIEPDRATFESLWDEAERLVRLSRSLDTLAAGDAGGAATVTDMDLAVAVRSAADLVRPSLVAAGLSLDVDVPASLPARADPDQLAQVLGNLLQNAVRYSSPGGRVGIHAERRPNDVLVAVSNTGDGIPPEDLQHVFERFYRVEKSRDRARGGAGIGLAIVRQLVEAAGGTVGAESRDGLTRFWFSLPAA
ncbi:MAG TPA: ATP-binding protein [Candidatus Limnocylindrales bacterium]|nr:ATP-binding protein [Candidatus Limnocylindrales bacterium]